MQCMENPQGASGCANWIVRDLRDDQHGSGLYACLLDTGRGNALVAFRGSESDTVENIVKDWIISDVGLLNSSETPQQKAARIYIQDIEEKYGKEYRSYSFTGHSLGGNLAEHAAITAPESVKRKLKTCVNLDGPGMSAKYLISHASDYKETANAIRHCQWSWVGALLMPVPGTIVEKVAAQTPEKGGSLKSALWRHETVNVEFDEGGSFVSGEKDTLAKSVDYTSSVLDLYMLGGMPAEIAGAVGMNLHEGYKNTVQAAELEKKNSPQAYAGRADYAADFRLTDGETGRLGSMADTLQAKAGEIRQICGRIPYSAPAVSVIRRRIYMVAGQLQTQGTKLAGLAEAGKVSVRLMRNTEERVGALFGK